MEWGGKSFLFLGNEAKANRGNKVKEVAKSFWRKRDKPYVYILDMDRILLQLLFSSINVHHMHRHVSLKNTPHNP